MSDTSLLEHRQQVTAYGQALFRISQVEFANTTEMQRQVCGAFLFGIIFVYGQLHRLTPPDVHALAISMLMDVLQYSTEQAGAFSTSLIEASSAGPQNTMNAIIHRGIEGHRQLTAGEGETLRQNLLGIFQVLGQPYLGTSCS